MSVEHIIAAINDDADRVQTRAGRCATAADVAGVVAGAGMLLFGAAVAGGVGWVSLPHPQVAGLAGLSVGPLAGVLQVVFGRLAARWYGDADELDALAERTRATAEAQR